MCADPHVAPQLSLILNYGLEKDQNANERLVYPVCAR
jgi:hypothetical protein